MTNAKLCKKLIERGIVISFGSGEIALGFNVPKDSKETKNTNFCVKNMEQLKTITLQEWTTAISK
jgi:hypothetical protein